MHLFTVVEQHKHSQLKVYRFRNEIDRDVTKIEEQFITQKYSSSNKLNDSEKVNYFNLAQSKHCR